MTPVYPQNSSNPPAVPASNTQKSGVRREDHGPILITALMMRGVAWSINQWMPRSAYDPSTFHAEQATRPIPLEMRGGDPHIRALMRTISASESNTAAPYHVIYGGQHVKDLSQHPEICVDIVAGPNVGQCSTAAGRYQFLDQTWAIKAKQYHPKGQSLIGFWGDYSFEPQFQDQVVYRWLTDAQAWSGVNIAELLRQGRTDRVFELLSGTWTSLGYGIEDNVVTPYLTQIYQEMLQEELAAQG